MEEKRWVLQHFRLIVSGHLFFFWGCPEFSLVKPNKMFGHADFLIPKITLIHVLSSIPCVSFTGPKSPPNLQPHHFQQIKPQLQPIKPLQPNHFTPQLLPFVHSYLFFLFFPLWSFVVAIETNDYRSFFWR